MKIVIVTPVPENYKKEFELPNVEVVYASKKDVTVDLLKDAEVVMGNLPLELLLQAPALKWVQLDSAGVGTMAKLPETVQLTNASGAYGEAISEHMIASALAIMKNLYAYYDKQDEHAWDSLGSVSTITSSTVLSIGMGDIGSSFAKKMNALGAEVIGIRRHEYELPSYLKAQGTMKDIDTYLPEADIVALSLPETKETIHLFDEERLRKMKKGAILLNVGRGSAIESEALIKVMNEGHLKGVSLDVTEWEPLPKNHALWRTPNVYITPHISGRFNAQVTYDKVMNIFITNLKHYLAKESLEHVVDKKAGY